MWVCGVCGRRGRGRGGGGEGEVVVVVQTMLYEVCLSIHAINSGGRSPVSQTPGDPATPFPP